jgi:hypothetical protein
MARSSIQGASPAPPQPAGRDTASLGPGDSSDSGSDMMGIADSDGGDPNAPADFDTRDEQRPTLLSTDALESQSDASGTGESRSAGSDAGKRDGWDIGVDRVFSPGGADAISDDEDPDLAFIDDAEAGDPLSDEEVDGAEEDNSAPPRPTSQRSPKR